MDDLPNTCRGIDYDLWCLEQEARGIQKGRLDELLDNPDALDRLAHVATIILNILDEVDEQRKRMAA